MCNTESGRVIRQQSDFGMTYVALCVPSGQICPDIRTVCPDAPRATRPSSFSFTLALSPSHSRTASGRFFSRRLDTKTSCRQPAGPRCHATSRPVVAARRGRGRGRAPRQSRGGGLTYRISATPGSRGTQRSSRPSPSLGRHHERQEARRRAPL